MKKYLFSVVIITLMFGCSSEKKESTDYNEASTVGDSTVNDTTGSSVKIIKTADMRFRVKDVQQTKEKLTANIKAQGGTVMEFEIHSVIQETNKVKYAIDSLKEITSYRKEGTLVAKVPSEMLDDFTNYIAKTAVFVDDQSMRMDDRSLAYLANKLKVKNREEAVKAIHKIGTKKGTNVETSLYIKDDYVDKKIENMYIDDKVKFSTITLNFYQDNTVHELIVGNDNLRDYGPEFVKRVGLNVVAGWSFLKEFVLGLITLWPFLVLGIGVFLTLRFLVKKIKK